MSYTSISRAALYVGAQHPGVALVRPARVVPVSRLLLIGDRAAGLLVPPFRALCRDHRCDLQTYCADDWPQKVGALVQRLTPAAVVVATSNGRYCLGLGVQTGAGPTFVQQMCGADMSATSLAAAAARAWQLVQVTMPPRAAGDSHG